MSNVEVICHMLTSLDGKANGELFKSKRFDGYVKDYYRLDVEHFVSRTPISFCGRRTLEGMVPMITEAELPKVEAGTVLRTDYWAGFEEEANRVLPDKTKRLFTVLDPRGVLGWKSNVVDIKEFPFYNGDFVVEVLVEDFVSDAYLLHLQSMKIPYIFAGKDRLDCRLAVEKMAKHFKQSAVTLHGGPTINGTFLHQGLLTQLSIIHCPMISGSAADLPLVNTIGPEMNGKTGSAQYDLKSMEKLGDSAIWLQYTLVPGAA